MSVGPVKPLGHKSYGSIPHLPGSRMGPGDHHCHAGQEAICTVKARDRRDRIIVTEKLDGSNVAIANVAGRIIALGRAGWPADTSKYEQHRMFAAWVRDRADVFAAWLAPGERFVGEWLAQAHGTRYEMIHDPFVVFDLMTAMNRAPHDEIQGRAYCVGLPVAHVLSDGAPFSIPAAIDAVASSHHGALDPVEGAVWRVERDGVFDFIAKFVRHDKRDGALLPEISGASAVWNWRPDGVTSDPPVSASVGASLAAVSASPE